MNKRFLLWAVVGLILFFVLSDDSAEVESNPFTFSLRTKAFFQNDCLKEIIGFDSPGRSKIRYCECVVDKFSSGMSVDLPLMEKWEATLASYSAMSGRARDRSRILAFKPATHFTSGIERLDILLRPYRLKYVFPEMEDEWKALDKELGDYWKKSLIGCTDRPPQAPLPKQSN